MLDWDLPRIGPPPGAVASASPLDVDLKLDPGSLVARARHFLGIRGHRRALADFEAALDLNRARPDARRGLIGILANGPVALRDLGRASELSRTALDRDPGNPADRGDLGMSLYRPARSAEAARAIEQAIERRPDAVDRARRRIFLAMSRDRLGQSQAARQGCQRARSEVADVSHSPSNADEFARLWAEADAGSPR